jgi:hypothetical protein
LVTVCEVSSLSVVLYGWLGREEEFPNWKVTYLSWQGKKKRNPPTWKLALALFLASMQTTAGVAKGVSRFSGT